MSDDVTKAVGEGVAKNMDDISKVSVWKRIASKVNLRVGTALGWGIGCGMLSNAAGMLAFDGTMKSKAAKEKEETFTLPNYTFTKNQLYKVTIAEGFKTPYFEIVENSAETSKPVKGKMPTMLVSGEKEIKGQKLTPEERILEVYPILTSRYEIRNVLLEHYEDYSKQRGIEKDTKRMFESSILKTYMAPKIQKLVFKYTGIKTLDCKDNTDRVEYLGEKPEGAEPLALAIATTYLTRMNYSTKIQEELDGKGTWLADKLRTAVEWRRSNSEEKMTIDTARKVFPEQGTKQEDLQKFVEDVAFWEQAYKNSTKNSVDFCQGTQ
jgi:hypothetical protein